MSGAGAKGAPSRRAIKRAADDATERHDAIQTIASAAADLHREIRLPPEAVAAERQMRYVLTDTTERLEETRAPAAIRYLEGLAVANGCSPMVARELIRRVVAQHADEPDSVETWVTILEHVGAAVQQQTKFGRVE